MKHKIFFLVLELGFGFAFTLALSGCGVEIKDKEKAPTLVEAAAKPDYVIDGPITLTEHQNIEVDRLVLTKNAVIITEDKNLSITAKELVSDGAVIQNFTEGQRAFWESNGRSGGSIVISVGKATGALQVHMRGEAGGNGKNGAITVPGKHPGCAGTNGGTGGNAGSLRAEIKDNNNFNLSYSNDEGAFGPGGIRGSVPMGTPYSVGIPCLNDGPEGANGAVGGRGQVCMKLGSEENFRCE